MAIFSYTYRIIRLNINLKYIVLSVGILAIYYILVQGIYYNIRIYGNVGYANSYALLLLIGIYFNRIREEDKFVDILEMIFMLFYKSNYKQTFREWNKYVSI